MKNRKNEKHPKIWTDTIRIDKHTFEVKMPRQLFTDPKEAIVWASGWSEAIVVHNLRDHETKHGERN
jgi:hypothetical protein